MASAKIIAPKRIYRDGTSPIFIQIIHDREKFKKQICKVDETYLDRDKMTIKSKHPLSYKLNALISKALIEANEYLIDCQLKRTPPDPRTFFGRKPASEDVATLIDNRAEELMDEKKYRTSQKYTSTANKLRFLDLSVPLSNVNLHWIERVKREMLKHGNIPNTVGKELSVISAVLNRVEGFVNPLLNYRKPTNKTSKAKLSMEEFKALENLRLTGREEIARRVFVFATLGRGIRAFDVLTLRWENIVGDRLKYTAKKTGKHNDIFLTPRLMACLDGLDRNSKYLFPFALWDYDLFETDTKRFLDHINGAAYEVNKHLRNIVVTAGITKHVTLHVARHTFGYLADQGGVPLGTIQQLLDHGKLTTTQIYVESLRRADELDKIVDGMFG